MPEKSNVHIAAAHLAAAVLGHVASNSTGVSGGILPINPSITDPDTRNLDLMAWELHRIFYHAIVGAMSSADWPDPPAEAAGPVAGLLSNPTALQGLLSGLLTGPTAGPLVGILKGLLGALPATSSPLPNPGVPAAPAK